MPLPDGPPTRPHDDTALRRAPEAAADTGAGAGGDAGDRPEAVVFRLDSDPDSVRRGRRFVVEQVRNAGATALIDDAALVVSELLANACQHGSPPVTVSVRATEDRIRIEVTDASPRPPVRARPSKDTMTGRGLVLVDQLAAAWGVDVVPGDGKTVWVEFSRSTPEHPDRDSDVDALLAGWVDDVDDDQQRFIVRLGDVPTDLLIDAKAHIDNLVREFSLAASGSETSGVAVPAPLAELMFTVVHGFGEARAAIKRQALAAAARGEVRTSLTLSLPLSAARAAEAYLQALDEADRYARAARLLTLETPPGHRVFRRWYVEAVIEQLHRAAQGLPIEQPVPFERRLLDEVSRLSSVQRASDRATRLLRVTAALARARTPEDVADVVVSEGVDALEASGGSLLVPAEDGEHIAVPGALGYGEELVDQLRAELIDEQLPAATAMRTGKSVWLESRQERDRQFPELRGFEPSTISMCAVPLEVGGRRLGALRFSFSSPRLFDEDERAFVRALAAQTAHTLERSELYLAERNATLQLQRALLPQALSVVPGWDIAAHYSPAGDHEVGGDWFDVIPLADGRVVAVVGDVMGRSIAAAAAMAQMRSALRAYVAVDPEPAGVLARLDHFFEIFEQRQLVTMLYLLADTATGSVQVVSAGHLPPLLVAADGTARRVDITARLPFGVQPDDGSAVTVDVRPGEALVAVTDGLVERRGEDIDVGIDRLIGSVRTADHASSEALLETIMRAASARRLHDDDVTVLVLRRAP